MRLNLVNTHRTKAHKNDHKSMPNINSSELQGFDPEFNDFIDYILKITYWIWEGKQPELCEAYYSKDCPVYMLSGMAVGADEVIENTNKTQAAFPDRTLDADAVICSGNAEDGFHSSHLINTKMTHLGDNELGKATGNHAEFKVIAHCVAKNNKIFKEWLVRDNYSFVEQLGFDPKIIAQQLARIEPQARFSEWMQSEFERIAATDNKDAANSQPYPDDAIGNEEKFITAILQKIWNHGALNEVELAYSESAQFHGSANRELIGPENIKNFYQAFIDTFSETRCRVDHVSKQAYRVRPEDTQEGVHVAARWTFSANHTGDKLYGEPTNAPILVMGISHYHIVDGKIIEEWAVFDELAILTQIYRARFQSQA